MKTLFEIKDVDKQYYREIIKDFLPDNIIDIHTHVILDKFRSSHKKINRRTVTWPSLVAKDNSIEDLMETYKLMFPEKIVTPLIFSSLNKDDDFDGANNYIKESALKYKVPSLIYARPEWSGEEFESKIVQGGFLGAKVYLSLAPDHISKNDVAIFDFLPHHQLEVLNNHGLIVMLHIPRDGRLKDPVNLEQMVEIENRYPNIKLIIAHVGRAYCESDIGNAFEVLSSTKNMLFDFCANTNAEVFKRLIDTVGPKRILFGSDMPILRMRMRRIVENDSYINIVPKGLYGDVSNDPNMREVEGNEAEKLSFFMYEEISAFREASESRGLNKNDIEDIFFNNSKKLINMAGSSVV